MSHICIPEYSDTECSNYPSAHYYNCRDDYQLCIQDKASGGNGVFTLGGFAS